MAGDGKRIVVYQGFREDGRYEYYPFLNNNIPGSVEGNGSFQRVGAYDGGSECIGKVYNICMNCMGEPQVSLKKKLRKVLHEVRA
jgi:hypothetical protein